MGLSLTLFGDVQITLDRDPVTGFESDKVRALLVYLVLEADHSHRRDALAEMFWPNRPQGVARNNLKQALANLRKVIGDRGADSPFLHVNRTSLQFNSDSEHWVDVSEFSGLLSACQAHNHHHIETCKPCIQRFQQAVPLYQGTFLEQFYLGDSAAFEEWAIVKRENLERQIREALVHLIEYHEQRGEYEKASELARRQVELEPWSETAQRALMRTLALCGRRSAALVQYQACRRVLADELGVEPSQKTTELFKQIRNGQFEQPAIPRQKVSPTTRAPPKQQRISLPLWIATAILFFVLGLGLLAAFQRLRPSRSTASANGPSAPLPIGHSSTAELGVSQAEYQALVALYNGTMGPGWKNADHWLSDLSPCAWFGVTCNEGTVTELQLADNDLSGSIPPEIAQLSHLSVLDLGFNQLTGSIPAELGYLGALRCLVLAGNPRLGGTIPPELGHLAVLEELILSSDSGQTLLTGSIPPELGNLDRLVMLDLSNSIVSGPIPPELGNLTNLRWLNLSFNRLTGPIPPELGNLSNLRHLSLHGNNQLDGPIPPELGNLGNLESLILSNEQGGTKLSGRIPPELGNLAQLRHLAISNCWVNGPIPPELGNLTDLTYLDLARIPLSGPIPPELGNLVYLETLSVGEMANDLEGPLPLTLMNLKNLYYFTYGNLTNLCEPPDPAFQEWLDSIPQLAGPRTVCQSKE